MKYPLRFELVHRAEAEAGYLDPYYLDYGLISKYVGSGEVCIDFEARNTSDHAVLSYTDKGRVVGLLKFDLEDGLLVSRGTWVRKPERRHGVALKLWELALTMPVDRVGVTVVSDRGKTLVEKLRVQHPHVVWDVVEDGDRVLRNLRKAG